MNKPEEWKPPPMPFMPRKELDLEPWNKVHSNNNTTHHSNRICLIFLQLYSDPSWQLGSQSSPK